MGGNQMMMMQMMMNAMKNNQWDNNNMNMGNMNMGNMGNMNMGNNQQQQPNFSMENKEEYEAYLKWCAKTRLVTLNKLNSKSFSSSSRCARRPTNKRWRKPRLRWRPKNALRI